MVLARHDASWTQPMLIPAWLLIIASIYFGIDSSLSLGIAEEAARYLFEASP